MNQDWVSILAGIVEKGLLRGHLALRQGRQPLHPAFPRKEI